MIPNRVQLSRDFTIGRFTFIGICISFACIGVMVLLNFQITNYFHLVFLLAFILPGIGYYFDQDVLDKRRSAHLHLDGFTACSFDELDSDLAYAFQIMKPHSFDNDTSVAVYCGTLNGNEIVLSTHEIDSKNDNNSTYTACALWSPLELVPATIRRKKGFKDRIGKGKEAQDHSLGETHIINSHDDQFTKTIKAMHTWFATKKAKPRHFRIYQPPGIHEQWSFYGHWIVFSDIGNADYKSTMKLADFLITFAIALEQHATSIPQNVHEDE